MKEASGEANMTVITIVLIAALAAIATPIISSMVSNAGKSSCCQTYGGTWKNGGCYSDGKKVTESYYWDKTNKSCKTN